ncbi:MAG: sodium:proton antiporter, partial [Chloroflexia bacterium]
GTSLVMFRIILAIVVANSVGGLAFAGQQFVIVVMGGLALGVAVGYAVSLLLSRVNDYLIETVMTIVVAYGSYLLAERLGVSSVITVVVAALVLGNFGHATAMSPTTRLAVTSIWEFIGFIANSLIFLLIGLELNIEKLGQYWVPTLLAIASVLLVRAVVVTTTSWLLKYIHRPLPYRWQGILVWGGLRGAVALAMALSLPLTLDSGEPFPNRDLLQIMTFGVILFSLLVQGLTMEPLARRLGLLKSENDTQDGEVYAEIDNTDSTKHTEKADALGG